jgi:hypothetical protein
MLFKLYLLRTVPELHKPKIVVYALCPETIGNSFVFFVFLRLKSSVAPNCSQTNAKKNER